MKFDSDVQNPKFTDFYGPAAPDGSMPSPEYLEDWLARTCELVAPTVSRAVRADTAFTLGLLHGVSEALGVSDAEFVAGLPALSDELRGALAGEPGPLRTVLDAVLAYEAGTLTPEATTPQTGERLAGAYLDALAWTTNTLAGAGQIR
jgi:c-di-GMP-related signal transduction protein